MAKRVTKTPEMQAQMTKILGDSVDTNAHPVYEALAGNTLPLTKRGTIFNKATISEGTLNLIANHINGQGLPFHTLHQQGSELPKGKVFGAKVVHNEQGLPELYTQFAIDPTETDLIAKLDQGILDEVSLGFLAAHLLCSECGFDFMGDDVGFMNFLNAECDEGHVMGQGGAHVNLTGLTGAYELSGVSQGAVQNAKVISPNQSRFTNGMKLAASGLDASIAVVLTGGPGKLQAESKGKAEGEYGPDEDAKYADPGYQKDGKPRYPLAVKGKLNEERIRAAWDYINKQDNEDKYTKAQVQEIKDRIIAAWKSAIDSGGPPSAQNHSQENSIMEINLSQIVTDLTDTKVKLATAETKATALEAEVARLTAELTAAKGVTPDAAQTELAALKPEHDAALKFMREHATKAVAALGGDVATVEKMTTAELAKTIADVQAKLSTLFPAGGHSKAAVSDAEGNEPAADLSAFKTFR